jgi:hypothetical protein
MGARINFVFRDGSGVSPVLYSHWGQDSWETDIAEALYHAKPRLQDSSYATRMMISYLTQHNVLDETGFGIYAIVDGAYDLGDQTVIIDFTDNTVTDNVPVHFDNFMQAYRPVAATAGVGVTSR